MIKKKATKVEGALRWKKISGGIHNHRDGQIVRKGEILRAKPEELSEVVKVGFVCLDDERPKVDVGFKLHNRGKGWWDVLNKETGEKLNDSALRTKEIRGFLNGTDEEIDEQIEKLSEKVETEEDLEEEDDPDATGKLTD